MVRAQCGAALLVVLSCSWPRSLPGQGLPLFHPLNPVEESRSGLYFQPYHPPHAGWASSVSLDYGSMIELNFRNSPSDTSYLLDAEVMRLNLWLGRDIGPRNFFSVETFIGGVYAGFLDGFLDWYHRALGIRFPERERRPRNTFEYEVQLPGQPIELRSRSGAYLGDLRLGFGHRYSRRLQSHVSLTLPTTTAPAGYGRGTPAIALISTYRAPLTGALTYEGSLGGGYTPRHGDLSDHQNQLFLSATSGLRYRIWDRLSLYGNLFYHSPYYHDTDLPALDRRDVTVDFGWILRTRKGHEWRMGLTEDPSPSGPAIDLNFRFGMAW